MAAQQALLSRGFSRQEHWSGLQFPSPMDKSENWNWSCSVKLLSRVQLSAIPWTAASQAPPSMGFSRQEYWRGVPLLSSNCFTFYNTSSLVVSVSVAHVQLFATPMDCSPPGASVHGILQARTLEWIAIAFSRGSSQPRDWTQVCCPAGRFFTIWATGKPGSQVWPQNLSGPGQNKNEGPHVQDPLRIQDGVSKALKSSSGTIPRMTPKAWTHKTGPA